jgi:hypothetical protein
MAYPRVHAITWRCECCRKHTTVGSTTARSHPAHHSIPPATLGYTSRMTWADEPAQLISVWTYDNRQRPWWPEPPRRDAVTVPNNPWQIRVFSAGRSIRPPNVWTRPRGQKNGENTIPTARPKYTIQSDLVHVHPFRPQIWARNVSARTAHTSSLASLLSAPVPADRGRLPHFPSLPLDRHATPVQTQPWRWMPPPPSTPTLPPP